MSWRTLLKKEEDTVILPWIGGKSLEAKYRSWRIAGKLPEEYGWCEFQDQQRIAKYVKPAVPNLALLEFEVSGYLVGNRLVPIDSQVNANIETIIEATETVHLLEEGIDRFSLIKAGRLYKSGPLIFKSLEFPQGGEDEVLDAFLDQKTDLEGIKNVSAGLHCAFLMETWYRDEAEKRRVELARLRREEEERLAKEAKRAELIEKLGDGAKRRELALIDFNEAAKAALAVGGATLLDVKDGRNGEKVVKYRYGAQRFECVCDVTMRIIDAGICLEDHRTGIKGDNLYTLESLPAVIQTAIDEGVLVIWRHV